MIEQTAKAMTAGLRVKLTKHISDYITCKGNEAEWCDKLELLNLSQCMRFPTMWHFDKCRLGRASAASF